MKAILYVYGTLRPGKEKTVLIPGTLYDLGWFPGIKLGHGPDQVVCEPVEVDDWGPIDRYEGFNESDPVNSLYIRQPLVVPYGIDGFIYEYNRDVSPIKRIESGDWLDFIQQRRGSSHGRFFA